MTKEKSSPAQVDFDVVVVGTGFAGIYALWQARQRGYTVKGFERAPDVGGTWYWNTYPGARCDVESYNYAYFFDNDIVREWDWSDACAAQGEIQRYLRFVAEKCGVLGDVSFNNRVVSATFDEKTGLWAVETSSYQNVLCKYVILAIGALSDPKVPDIKGVSDFNGESYFTSDWPKDEKVVLDGKRVGVIGTGSSGVQVIPEIAEVASELTVFQRTANYVTPTRSGPMDDDLVAALRKDPQSIRREFRQTYGGHTPLEMGEQRFLELDEEGREQALQDAWDKNYIALAFRDAYLPEANQAISDFIRERMREQVEDTWTAQNLVPWDHPYGGKRPCMSNVYLQTFNRANVRLVSLRDTPIDRIVPDGIVTKDEEIPLDVIVYATGFDAISGPVFAIDISGIDGKSMKHEWAEGPKNYLGTMVNGFPNLFMPSSALSPSVLSNMATLAEQQVDFIFDKIDRLEAGGHLLLQPLAESQEQWQAETLRYAKRRPGALTTKSWYSGANIPGKPQTFMVYCGGFKRYNDRCYQEIKDNFPGYEIKTAPEI